MKRIMNISTYISDIGAYRDNQELKGYYRSLGLDGVELLQWGEDERRIVFPEDVVGVHLLFYPCWRCFWEGNAAGVLDEFGSWEEAKRYYGGAGREALLSAFQKNLEFAKLYNPEYVVFHVSDALLSEVVTRKHRYTDEEVADSAADLINSLFSGDEGFTLLLENLWWPGMRLTRPEVTYSLLEKINYPDTGIMLDTGHLMNTNTALRTQAEGVSYIRSVLEQYEDRSIFHGVHFHQTLSGAYVEEQKKHPPVLSGSHAERNSTLGEYVLRVDSHRPFTCPESADLIRWIDPEYLVYELIYESREEQQRLIGEYRI